MESDVPTLKLCGFLQDLERKDKPYMVCEGCDRHVNACVAFRNTCRRNYELFKQEQCNEIVEDDDDKDEAMGTFAGAASEVVISCCLRPFALLNRLEHIGIRHW